MVLVGRCHGAIRVRGDIQYLYIGLVDCASVIHGGLQRLQGSLLILNILSLVRIGRGGKVA